MSIPRRPTSEIVAHIAKGRAGLFLDLAGEALHRRGYRVAMVEAPLKETLAAAVLALGGPDPDLPFIDPMCGSGTLAIEHALAARGIAPGLRRRFGFERWPTLPPDTLAAFGRSRAEAEAHAIEALAGAASAHRLRRRRSRRAVGGAPERVRGRGRRRHHVRARRRRRARTPLAERDPRHQSPLRRAPDAGGAGGALSARWRASSRPRLEGWRIIVPFRQPGVRAGVPAQARRVAPPLEWSARGPPAYATTSPLIRRAIATKGPTPSTAPIDWRVVAPRLGLSLLAAALLFLSVPTAGLWPLMWVSLVPQLHVALAASTDKRAFLYGWLTGTAANAVAFSWMNGLLERFGHMPAIESIPIVGLLVAYQGLAFALFSWGVRRAWRRTALPLALLAPLVMVTIELAMPRSFPTTWRSRRRSCRR